MRIRLLLLAVLTATMVSAATVPVIPAPFRVDRPDSDNLDLSDVTTISLTDDVRPISRQALGALAIIFPQLDTIATEGDIIFRLDTTVTPEAYRLNIDRGGISLSAGDPAGLFYGVQTLTQIVESQPNASTIEAVEITDSPRFGWRGFMLDEGRHFFGKEEVKRLLDLMALYKLNRFHWHLTDDQGWRMAVAKYPRLTSVGAWRESEKLGWRDVQSPELLRDSLYGGFYTESDLREIVDYAADRMIEVIPEIDMPGHTRAAIAAYPEILACDPDSAHSVWLWQGVTDDVINVANPAAVAWAKDIIDTLIDIFPSHYIHLGGDECPTDKWQTNTQCSSRLAEIDSDNYRDLQLDFYHQLQNHIDSLPADKQRKLIFWNEVLHGNTELLSGNDYVIMAWIGREEADKAALEAASKGLKTILTPQIPYYLNRRQSTSPDEPLTQGEGNETIEAVYSYTPMSNTPDSLKSNYLGVQANFWSEYVDSPSLLEYLLLPRLAAVAETAWSAEDRKDFGDFKNRIRLHKNIYTLRRFNFAPHIFE